MQELVGPFLLVPSHFSCFGLCGADKNLRILEGLEAFAEGEGRRAGPHEVRSGVEDERRQL